jgi:hypothetical protein
MIIQACCWQGVSLSLLEKETFSSRRSFFEKSTASFNLFAASLLHPPICQALNTNEEGVDIVAGKPFAPISALLPAARCKLWIDRAHQLSTKLKASTDGNNNQAQTLEEINNVLSNRPKLFIKGEKALKRTNTFSAQITTSVSSANKEQWQQNRKSLNPIDGVAAMWNQADVERQWGMLQASEAQREQSNDIRAALNYYTQQLEFGDSYKLTASKEDRKRMIRDDQLPTLTAVITSDLDLRDLYRNQLLTALDDSIAEANYQFKEHQAAQPVDTTDLVGLMDEAYIAASKWFALISAEDLQEAMVIVSSE